MPWEKQFNKNEALDKAMQAFWTRGYEATSMQDLVECTGVNRGSLYATYGDKHALFLSALRAYDERRRHMLTELERQVSPHEAVRRLFTHFIDETDPEGINKGCFLTNTALELAAHDPAVKQLVAEAQADLEAFFLRMIRKTRNAGGDRPEVGDGARSRAMLASLLGLLVLARSRPDPELLHGIMTDALKRLE